jgi:hypothetical protein
MSKKMHLLPLNIGKYVTRLKNVKQRSKIAAAAKK